MKLLSYAIYVVFIFIAAFSVDFISVILSKALNVSGDSAIFIAIAIWLLFLIYGVPKIFELVLTIYYKIKDRNNHNY